MSNEKNLWESSVWVSYVPTDSDQVQIIDCTTDQQVLFSSLLKNLREQMLHHVKTNFNNGGNAPIFNGLLARKIIFTIAVERKVFNG